MARKKSARKAARDFIALADELNTYCNNIDAAGLSKQETNWAYEMALVKLTASFERLMLAALVAAINNDTALLSQKTGIDFPKHLTDEVCEFIVTGGSYFDFKGRDGLINTLCRYLPNDHYLVTIVKRQSYKQSLDRLIALRNFGAHESPQSKRRARESVGTQIGTAGSWIKRQQRFSNIATRLQDLARQIETSAPY